MQRPEYSKLLNEIENYARVVNSLFTKYKPHDDRCPEERRRDALYSAFYVLKTLLIMLYPFVPDTMNRLRAALRLDHDVFQRRATRRAPCGAPRHRAQTTVLRCGGRRVGSSDA
jgi:methionyl-tRNA synthetase